MPKTKTSREEIIIAAWREFHARGYGATSVQRLATAAGLGKAGLLHHFGSKEGVMHAVIDYALEWYRSRVLTMLRTDEPLSVRLERFIRRHFELCVLNDGAGCFFANTILETGVDGTFGEQTRKFHDEWTAATETMFREWLPAERAAEFAYRLFADYQGSVVLYKLYRDRSHLDRFLARTLGAVEELKAANTPPTTE